MKRLIEIANKQINEYLDENNIQRKHNDQFNCMGTDIFWKDVPDDLDLTGYDINVVNVLYDDCKLQIKFSDYNNIINIDPPKWIKEALFSARIQGQSESIDILTKLRFENNLTKQGIDIPYNNTVS